MALAVSLLPSYGFDTLAAFLRVAPVLIGACFTIGFVLLALARRVGLAILWLGMLAMWFLAIRPGVYPFAILTSFPGWTVFAVPLYVLTAVGLTAPSDGPPRWSWLRFEIPITLLVWLGAVALSQLLSPPQRHDLLGGSDFLGTPYGTTGAWIVTYVCAAWPFVIGARELVRIVLAVREQRPSSV